MLVETVKGLGYGARLSRQTLFIEGHALRLVRGAG